MIQNQDYSVLLNNKWLLNAKIFTQRQIWQLTDQTENQETVIEFRFRTDHIDMSNAGVYRADVDQIQQVLENRKKQGLHVTKFSNTHIVGDVSITDDSNYIDDFHSIQRWLESESGWEVCQNWKSMECILIVPNLKGKS